MIICLFFSIRALCIMNKKLPFLSYLLFETIIIFFVDHTFDYSVLLFWHIVHGVNVSWNILHWFIYFLFVMVTMVFLWVIRNATYYVFVGSILITEIAFEEILLAFFANGRFDQIRYLAPSWTYGWFLIFLFVDLGSPLFDIVGYCFRLMNLVFLYRTQLYDLPPGMAIIAWFWTLLPLWQPFVWKYYLTTCLWLSSAIFWKLITF